MVGVMMLGLFLLLAAGVSLFFQAVLKQEYEEDGTAALYTLRAFVDNIPDKAIEIDALDQQVGRLLDEWGASYLIYPVPGSKDNYLATHKFGPEVMSSQLLDTVLKRGHIWRWKQSAQVLRPESNGAPRIAIEEIPGAGKYMDFSTTIEGRQVHIGYSESVTLASIRSYLMVDILGIAGIFFAGLSALYFILRRQFAGLDQLIGYARKLGRREFTAFCPVNEQGELGVIAGALQSAAGDLRATYDQLDEASRHNSEVEAEALRQVSSLHGMIDLAAEGIAFTSARGEMILVNELFCSLVRMSEEELLGQTFGEIGLEGVGSLIASVVGRLNAVEELEIDMPGGRIGHFSVCAAAPQGPSPAWSGVVVVREVSSEQRGEEVIGDRLRSLLDSLADRASTIVGLSPVARQHFNEVHALVPDEEAALQEMERVLSHIEERSGRLLHILERSSNGS